MLLELARSYLRRALEPFHRAKVAPFARRQWARWARCRGNCAQPTCRSKTTCSHPAPVSALNLIPRKLPQAISAR